MRLKVHEKARSGNEVIVPLESGLVIADEKTHKIRTRIDGGVCEQPTWFDAKDIEGATFSFTLPLAGAAS